MRHIATAAAIVLGLCQPVFAETTDCKVEGTAALKTMSHTLGPAEQEIMHLERVTCRLLVAREIDKLMDDHIAEHGVVLLDGGGLAVGREGQRKMFKEFLGAGYDIIYEPADAHVSADDTMAWAIGAYKLTAPDGEVDIGKYTSVWERIDGEWKNVVEMRNSSN